MATAAEQASVRLSRLLALVPWLMNHPGVTVREAADHFAVSESQLLRDLDLLIVSGRPGHMHGDLLDIQYWDEGGHIHVLDPQTLDRPLALTATEAAALLVALYSLQQVPGDHDRAALAGAISKLEAATAGQPPVARAVGIAVDSSHTELLNRAIQSRLVVEFSYLSGTDQSVTARSVEPLRLAISGGYTYLEAWCRSADAIRTFRTDRITNPVVTETTFPSRPSAHDLFADLTSFVRVRTTASTAWIADLWGASTVEHRADGGLVIDLPVGDPEWLIRLALQCGTDLTVADAEISAEVQRRAQAALSHYL